MYGQEALLNGEEIQVDTKNCVIKARIYSKSVGFEGVKRTFNDIHTSPAQKNGIAYEFCEQTLESEFCDKDFWDMALLPPDDHIVLITSIVPKRDTLIISESDINDLIRSVRKVTKDPLCLLISLSLSNLQAHKSPLLSNDEDDRPKTSKRLVTQIREHQDILAAELGFEPLFMRYKGPVVLRKQDMNDDDPVEIVIVSVYIRREDAVR